jgi:hypothetical protein
MPSAGINKHRGARLKNLSHAPTSFDYLSDIDSSRDVAHLVLRDSARRLKFSCLFLSFFRRLLRN